MSVKVIMTWDIAAERDQEYFEFVVGEFVPGVQRLGLQPAEAWATIYGSYPQIQVGLIAADLPQARRILASADWALLQERLFGYVQNYSYKIVPARNGFQFKNPLTCRFPNSTHVLPWFFSPRLLILLAIFCFTSSLRADFLLRASA
jgi:hypothetical protein